MISMSIDSFWLF